MPTIRITLAYEGTDFAGWQHQRNGLSVQEVLETALQQIVGHPVACRAAGRTDSGVHALGQVVTFQVGSIVASAHPRGSGEENAQLDAAAAPFALESAPRQLSIRSLVHGTNYHLPKTVRVLAAQVAADDFDARFSASGKLYRYQLWNAETESPLHYRTHWHVRAALDIEAMRRAAQLLVGHHDFRAFRAANCERKTTDRTVRRLAVFHQVGCAEAIHIEVEGTAFLRNMVRIIAGTLVYVGRGKLTEAHVATLLRSGDRSLAGPTAPAGGLVLCRVDYGPRVGL